MQRRHRGRSQRTTALFVDDDVLIDAGTGVGDPSSRDLLRIDHVFVTHAHLDHIAMIPPLVDTVGEARSMPIVVHGSAETLRILRSHLQLAGVAGFLLDSRSGQPFPAFPGDAPANPTHIGGGRQGGRAAGPAYRARRWPTISARRAAACVFSGIRVIPTA